MKVLLAALLIAAAPVLSLAQSRGSSSGASSSLPPVLGPIGLPLPPIGLGLPPIGLSPVVETPSTGPREAPGRGPGRGRRPGFKHVPTIVYFLPTTDWWPSGVSYATDEYRSGTTTFDPYVPPVADPPLRITGTLRMEMQPAGPHPTYIDGAYIGTLDDFHSELSLEPGRHTVEVRAPGFEPLTFDVSIQGGRIITYRGTLKSAALDPSRDPRTELKLEPPATPSVIYFVPGCYLGNIPPAQLKLPEKCDLSKTITSKQ